MVEENLEFWNVAKSSRMKEYLLFLSEYCHHGRILNLNLLKWSSIMIASEWILFTMVEETFELACSGMLQNEGISNCSWMNSFTMVEENFEFECSEMLQNEGISNCFWMNTFTMVEENLEFECSEVLLNEGISYCFWVNIFTMVEENFWIWMLWEAPEWRNF